MKKLLARLDLSYLYALLGEMTLGLTLVFYIILARVLGPEDYGTFAASVALGAILALIIQFGLPVLLNREVAANPEVGCTSTVKFLLLEVLLSIPILALLFPLTKVLGYQNQGQIICYIVVLSEICRAAKMTLRSVLKGLTWFRSDSIAVAIERTLVVLLATAVLFVSKNIILVVSTVVIVRFLDVLGFLYYLSQKVNVWSPINVSSFSKALRAAYPFALSGVLWILYYQVDLVMLQAISSSDEAGFYSASYRILEIFAALPRAIFYVIFTRLAKHHATSPEKIPEQMYKGTRILLIGVLPPAFVAACMPNVLVNVLYSDTYSSSVLSLYILLPSISVSMFGNFALRFLQATDREKFLPLLLLATTGFNVVCNALLIPQLGGPGAAIATFLSEVILCGVGWGIVYHAGYKKASTNIVCIAALGLIIAAMPSLVWNGFSPALGVGLTVGAIVGTILLTRRDRFLSA